MQQERVHYNGQWYSGAFTAKGTDLYVFVDGLEEGTTEFDIPNIFGELTPLNKELRTEFEKTASGTRLIL